jgi:site-specific DNA-methyltransferase (adenine-specific)
MSHTGERNHPTEKPVGLMRWCIEKTTADTVVDPFMGSGSTLVAARQVGRLAVGADVEERYCEVAAKRLAQGVFDFGAAS